MSTMHTFDFTLRYQRTPCARYHVRPLTLLQQDIMYRCDGRVTVADLADATKYTHPEVRAVLRFLIAHGLVKTLTPEPWLFAPIPHQMPQRSPEPAQGRARPQRFWRVLKHRLLTSPI
ncbi:MAG TPA: hypothetical protein VKT82_01495 [Ktedonobacterales bacterium]|nr:hypothetical protein [Ktedonobacterales bacterium]